MRRCAFSVLIADDLIGERRKPTRYVIDFQGKDVIEAQSYKGVFQLIKAKSSLHRKAADRERRSEQEKH